MTVENIKPASHGRNFGALDVVGDSVKLSVDDQITLEFRTEDITQVVKQGDQQVELQFEERAIKDSSAQLMRIQFYVPEDHSSEVAENNEDLDEDEIEALSTGAGRLRHRLVAAAGITSVTGEKILALPDDVGTFLAPRGRYVLEMYQTYFRMYGKQYDNRVFYQVRTTKHFGNRKEKKKNTTFWICSTYCLFYYYSCLTSFLISLFLFYSIFVLRILSLISY